MNQYNQLLEHYIQLKSNLVELHETLINENQLALAKKIQNKCSELDHFLSNTYIDFEKICDNLPDALYIAGKDGTSLYVNDMYQQLSGLVRSEIVGESVYQLNKDQKLYVNGVLPSILKYQKRKETIGLMKRTNTSVYITGFPIFDVHGELKYAVAHDRNIQQLQTVKDQLLRLQESQEKAEAEVHYLRKQQMNNSEMVYRTPAMKHAFITAVTVAPTDASVLITGESGTGKEVIANEIYKASNRFEKPFIRINCAAIPDSLMESELFGYAPGAFTGASKHGKTGIFEMANHGTLLLDEIGEMSIQMQSKLLRVLQNHEIVRVGDTKLIPIDVRIIAATNKNLQECIRDHTFREDLYYRLNVVPIKLPPLRERIDDMEPLINHFLEHYTKKYNKHIDFESNAIEIMKKYPWPGNIRELENVIERLVVINESSIISSKDVTLVLGIPDAHTYHAIDYGYNLKEATTYLETQIIEKALKEFGSKRKAAAALGIDHSTLVKKCQRYQI